MKTHRFDDGEQAVVGMTFVKPDKCSGVSFLRYGIVLGFNGYRTIVRMADLQKDTMMESLEKCLAVPHGFFPNQAFDLLEARTQQLTREVTEALQNG